VSGLRPDFSIAFSYCQRLPCGFAGSVSDAPSAGHASPTPGSRVMLVQLLREHDKAPLRRVRVMGGDPAIGWEPGADRLGYEVGVWRSPTGGARFGLRAICLLLIALYHGRLTLRRAPIAAGVSIVYSLRWSSSRYWRTGPYMSGISSRVSSMLAHLTSSRSSGSPSCGSPSLTST
jgi:hypothetical protein